MRMRQIGWVGAIVVGLMALAGCHREPTDTSQAPAAAASSASSLAIQGNPRELAVGRLFHRKYPRLKIERVTEVQTDDGASPMYVVEASGKTFATTPEVNFLVEGGTIITGVGDHVRNVSNDLGQMAAARVYAKLPFASASITKVYGKGERQMVMFSDPDCPVCQAFEKALDSKGAALDATVHIFAFPLANAHPDAIRKAAYLMCTRDPGNDWHDWMIHADEGWDKWAATHPSEKSGDCPGSTRVALGSVLGHQLGFSKTPTLMFPNGAVLEGAPTLDSLDKIWAQPAPQL